MQCIIYVRDSGGIPIYEQYNKCADYAKRYGYSISGKVLDFEGNRFHEAVNQAIPKVESVVIIIYSKNATFDSEDDFLFFRIYLEKLGHKLVSCT